MDFVRFTGEWAIYYALIAFGGGVLVALTMGAFSSIGLDAGDVVITWLLPSAAAGAVIVAAWLVEAKQSVIENMAPVLTKVFTPLTALLLLAFLAAAAVTATRGRRPGVPHPLRPGAGADARTPAVLLFRAGPVPAPGCFDKLQLVLLVSALVVDLLMLAAMVGRISEFGFSPNKTARSAEPHPARQPVLGGVAAAGLPARPAGVPRAGTVADRLPAGLRGCGPRSWWWPSRRCSTSPEFPRLPQPRAGTREHLRAHAHATAHELHPGRLPRDETPFHLR
jgi:hypothetical protein